MEQPTRLGTFGVSCHSSCRRVSAADISFSGHKTLCSSLKHARFCECMNNSRCAHSTYSSELYFVAVDTGGVNGKETRTAVSRTTSICRLHRVLYYIDLDKENETSPKHCVLIKISEAGQFLPQFQGKMDQYEKFSSVFKCPRVLQVCRTYKRIYI